MMVWYWYHTTAQHNIPYYTLHICEPPFLVSTNPVVSVLFAGGQVDGGAAIFGYFLIAIFFVDILVNFNLAYYDEEDEIIWDRKRIAINYYKSGMLLVDFLGVFPFYLVVLAASGEVGNDNSKTQYLNLFRLIRLVRLYRVRQLYEIVRFSTKVSFMALTLGRNFLAGVLWTHLNACIFYFIARQHNFNGDNTWIGGSVEGATNFERYCTSLYWSITSTFRLTRECKHELWHLPQSLFLFTAFTTVGYGDFSPVNEAEQIFVMIYMMVNIVLQAWVIGSIALLINKQDEHTGQYRDMLQTLEHYADAHHFDFPFYQRLKTQLKLDFDNRDISDEHVLKDFPYSVRRKVLRRLYLPSLFETHLLSGVRHQYIDAFLAACKVEIFSPGEELLSKGNVPADLYLVVGGVVSLSTRDRNTVTTSSDDWESEHTESVQGGGSGGGTSNKVRAGEFVNAIGFLTQTPQMESARTVSVCKLLTLSRANYRTLCQDYPDSTGVVLQNLLAKVQSMTAEEKPELTAGKSVRFDPPQLDEAHQTQRQMQLHAAETTVKDLIQMHINKLRDDRTTRFLFAASRGDMSTLTILLSQGIDPDAADYDRRTGLMVAAMNGQTEVCKKLLEYNANPNLTDMHGSSALLEATTNAHEQTMRALLENGASLCLSEDKAASTLCQAVFDGDVTRLRRLIQAGISVNAGDYDKRTAIHIAAAEGNVTALKVMVEEGKADLNVRDRWNNSAMDEAKRTKSGPVLEYLESKGLSAS